MNDPAIRLPKIKELDNFQFPISTNHRYARTGLYYPYYTTKALGGRGHDHYFEGVLESLLDDPEGFSIQGFEEYYSKREIEMLGAIQRKLKETSTTDNCKG